MKNEKIQKDDINQDFISLSYNTIDTLIGENEDENRHAVDEELTRKTAEFNRRIREVK
jgi:hypothetical protein